MECPEHLLVDRGYAHDRCRKILEERGIAHTIPEHSDQRERREPPGAAGLKPQAQRGREVRQQAQAVATRYLKLAVNYRAVVVIASLMLWLAS